MLKIVFNKNILIKKTNKFAKNKRKIKINKYCFKSKMHFAYNVIYLHNIYNNKFV